ncbi:MAG: twin-arginine translocation signal domain-containing protein, partial [Gemmatales bacterium]|nr:twin-arginine translocation signal domain-containing protein [Gemmatales bacterium]
MSRPNLSRRRFLQLAGLTGTALAASAGCGAYALWQASSGEPPPNLSPYFERNAWRWSPAAPRRLILVLTPNTATPPSPSRG